MAKSKAGGTKKLDIKRFKLKRNNLVIFALAFAIVGGITLLATRAAAPSASIEPETSSSITSPATKVTGDSSASSAGYVKFNAASTGGGGGSLADPLCTWPGIANQQYPCPADTGVPSGTSLTTYTGPNPITTDGTTINSKDFGVGNTVYVQANNVTITNSRMGLVYVQSGTNLKVNYSEINGASSGCNGNDAVQYGSYSLDHDKIINFSDGPRDSGSNITITNSYILACYNAGDHADGIQGVGGGANLVIRHNTIDSENRSNANAAIFLSDTTAGGTVDNNFLAGGQYVLQATSGTAGSTFTYTNNVILKNSWNYGPCNYITGSWSIVHTGQRYEDGTAISGC